MARSTGLLFGVQFLLGHLLVGCGPSAAVPIVPPAHVEAPARPPLEVGREALERARYAEAETALRRAFGSKDDGASRTLLVRLLRETGRSEEAIRLAEETTADGLEKVEGAEALERLGRLDEALAFLDRVPSAARTFVHLERSRLRGEILLQLGRVEEARTELLRLVAAYNDETVVGLDPAEKREALALVGRAAHLLRSPADANEAFNEAEEAGDASLRTLFFRAELFLEKFDLYYAEEVALEALERAPNHPDALVLLAEVRLGQALDLTGARELGERALAVNPAHTRARFVRAGTHLRDLDFGATDREIDAGLAVNPRHLELLGLRAAARLLREDEAGFEAVLAEVERLSPGHARVYDLVAEFAEWEHRYEEIEKLLRRGVRLDREDGRLRANLGLTLVRAGSDAAGIVELRRAFELDPYNVRALNTLELYEGLAQRYDEVRRGPFVFRFPKAERAVLERYVPELLERAHASMVERYGFSPKAPIGIEIYATKKEFAVRTTGLPQAGIAGVCFGRKLATVSPRGTAGNLAMTLWHELSHVFHMGLSGSRVPRWLTEGFAEWETARLDRGWSRELDLELYRAVLEDRLPELGRFNRAFTYAESMDDIAIAYHASKRVADFVVKTRGEPRAARLFAELGTKRGTDVVVPEVLGASFSDLDREFREFLVADYAHYGRQFVSRLPRAPLEELEKKAAARGATRADRIALGLGFFREARLGDAVRVLGAVIAEAPDPLAAFYLARAWLAQGDVADARGLVKKTIASGSDGYELRMLLARIAASEQDWKEVFREASNACDLDPTQLDAWSMRAAAAHELGETENEIRALTGWARLSEHDADIHRRLLELLLEHQKYAEARVEAEATLWAGLGAFATHRLTYLAFAYGGDAERATFELETARLLATSPAARAELDRDEAAVRSRAAASSPRCCAPP